MAEFEEMWNACARGDGRAWQQLYTAYSGNLYAFIRRLDVADSLTDEAITDLIHTAFLKLYEKRGTFRPQRGQASLLMYLYRTVRNQLIDQARKKRLTGIADPQPGYVQVCSLDSYYDEDEGLDIAVADPNLAQEEIWLLGQALESLSPEYREVIILHYLLEWPYEQIASALGIAVNTVGTRLLRAREALGKWWKKQS